MNIEIPKDNVTEDQQLHFEVQEIHNSIERQESEKYSKDKTDELQKNPVITIVKKEIKNDQTSYKKDARQHNDTENNSQHTSKEAEIKPSKSSD